MQRTTSVTAYPNSPKRMEWKDRSTRTTYSKLQIDNDGFFSTTRLADSTNDGGVLIDNKSPIKWRMYGDSYHIINVLLEVNEKFEGNSRYIDHSLALYQNPVELPLDAIHWMESITGLSQDRIGKLIGVSRQAINVWKRGGRIADDNRQRIFAVRDVLKRAQTNHPSKDLLTTWLDTPRGADGRTPAQLIEANEINRARLLAMSSPSPRLKTVPSWVNRPIPEAFRAGAERRQEALPYHVDDEAALMSKDEDDMGEDEEESRLHG